MRSYKKKCCLAIRKYIFSYIKNINYKDKIWLSNLLKSSERPTYSSSDLTILYQKIKEKQEINAGSYHMYDNRQKFKNIYFETGKPAILTSVYYH